MREVIAVDSWPSERETVCRHHRLSARSGLPSCRIAAYARFADQTLVNHLLVGYSIRYELAIPIGRGSLYANPFPPDGELGSSNEPARRAADGSFRHDFSRRATVSLRDRAPG